MGYLHVESLAFDEILEFLVVQALEQPLSALLHLDETRLEPLPQLVVSGTPHVRAMPDVVLDELLDLVDPLRLEHILFYRLNCNHKPCHVLNEDIVTRDEQLLLFVGLSTVKVAHIGLTALNFVV